jgi:hypothetical protein
MHKLLSRTHFLVLTLAFTPASATADVIDLPDFLSTFLAPDSMAVDEVLVFDQFKFSSTAALDPEVYWLDSSTSDLGPDRPGKGGLLLTVQGDFKASQATESYTLSFRVRPTYPVVWLGGYSIDLLGAGATGSGSASLDGIIQGVKEISTTATANSPAARTTATFDPRPELIAQMQVTLDASGGTAFMNTSGITFVTVPIPHAGVPEPGSAVLLVLGVAVLMGATRLSNATKHRRRTALREDHASASGYSVSAPDA